MFLKSSGVLVLMAAALKVLGIVAAPATKLHQVTALPQDIRPCPEDANFNECLRTALNALQSKIATGITELNIPPMDPLQHDVLNVQLDNNLIRGRAAVYNVTILGLSKKTVAKIEYERKGNQVRLVEHFNIPKVQVKGLYEADVQLNNAGKFTPKGKFDITMINIQAQSELLAELYVREGHTFLNLTAVNLDPTLGDMHISATGLSALPILNDAILQMINSNWRANYKSVIANNKATWEPIVKHYANEFFAHLPIELLIPGIKI